MNQEILFENQHYSSEDIQNATLIIHPKAKGYNIKADEIAQIFEEGSNFTHLENPIQDEFGNQFRDSEGYYMAKRTDNLEIKKKIAFLSIGYGLASKSRKLFPLEMDESKRIQYMREAITLKFNNNSDLREKLLNTGKNEIIEYTFWKDTLFGIDQETLQGKNVLGKLLMEYRDSL